MRMINFGKSFRIQSENPVEARALFEAGQSPSSPRAGGLTMSNDWAIDFLMGERREVCLVAEYLYNTFGDRDAWAFDTLCGAALRGEQEACA